MPAATGKWRARLSGSERDLKVLAEHSTSKWTIVHEGDESYLTSPDFEFLTDASDVRKAAEGLVPKLNATGRYYSNQFGGVRCRGVVHVSPEGKRHVVVFGSVADALITTGSATVTVGGVPVGNAQVQPELPIEELLTALDDEADVVRVAGEFGNSSNKWTDRSWKTFELIRENVGGSKVLTSEFGWATNDEVERFREGINDPQASGNDARHAKLQGELRSDYMRESEAESFIKALFEKWLRWKYDQLDG